VTLFAILVTACDKRCHCILFELAMFVRVYLYIFGQEDEHGIETLSHMYQPNLSIKSLDIDVTHS